MKLDSRTLAAAFWVNFFALYWLYILGVVEMDMRTVFAWLFFLAGAAMIPSVQQDTPKRGDGNGRKPLP